MTLLSLILVSIFSFKNPYAAKSGGSDVRVNKLVVLSVIVLVINVFWTKLRYSR